MKRLPNWRRADLSAWPRFGFHSDAPCGAGGAVAVKFGSDGHDRA
jgi:hypothetical protein